MRWAWRSICYRIVITSSEYRPWWVIDTSLTVVLTFLLSRGSVQPKLERLFHRLGHCFSKSHLPTRLSLSPKKRRSVQAIQIRIRIHATRIKFSVSGRFRPLVKMLRWPAENRKPDTEREVPIGQPKVIASERHRIVRNHGSAQDTDSMGSMKVVRGNGLTPKWKRM